MWKPKDDMKTEYINSMTTLQ